MPALQLAISQPPALQVSLSVKASFSLHVYSATLLGEEIYTDSQQYSPVVIQKKKKKMKMRVDHRGLLLQYHMKSPLPDSNNEATKTRVIQLLQYFNRQKAIHYFY